MELYRSAEVWENTGRQEWGIIILLSGTVAAAAAV